MKKNNNIKLDNIGNQLPFSVPENYFEDFAAKFEAEHIVVSVPVKRLLKPWMYMAAMFLGVFFILFSLIFFTPHGLFLYPPTFYLTPVLVCIQYIIYLVRRSI